MFSVSFLIKTPLAREAKVLICYVLKSKMSQKKVVVALSGGVDSSVAAALLLERGFDVIGVTMNIFSLPQRYCQDQELRSCCGVEAIQKAHHIAMILGISHYVLDFKDEFEKHVISDFCQEYSCGRTPNPCIRCNAFLKFGILFDKAKRLGADHIATGHYGRIIHEASSGRYFLKKSKDKEKDQSYFLYFMTQAQLSRVFMPVGDYTKKQVRSMAQKWGLPTADRLESQEICFIPDNNYVRFLERRMPRMFSPGPIVDVQGKRCGVHQGIAHFTVGQRRGIGIAASQPLYVLEIRSKDNTVVVGGKDLLYHKKLLATGIHWTIPTKGERPIKAKVKIRYQHEEASARLTLKEADKILVEFEKPQRAITPGQAVVFYKRDVLLGGGIIERTL